MPDNLSLRHALSQISPPSALPLASRLFLKLAEKLLRVGRGGAEAGSRGGRGWDAIPAPRAGPASHPGAGFLQMTEQNLSISLCFSKGRKG